MAITDSIRDVMEEVLTAADQVEGSERQLLLIAHAQLVAAYDVVWEVNSMRLGALLNGKVGS